jgi:alpha-L-fucosidase 2
MKIRLLILFFISTFNGIAENSTVSHNLKFAKLAQTWDEGIPLGNGMLGELVWQKDGKLRFSLDRADLWDLRPMQNLNTPEFNFKWVQQQVKSNNYKIVQDLFDAPYDNSPAPSKIPGAALEFDISHLGEVQQVELSLKNALCDVRWKSGATLQTFVHANQQVGWFKFDGISTDFIPELMVPDYKKEGSSSIENSVVGQDLQRLGYEQGKIIKGSNLLTYRQKGWGGFEYEVAVTWKQVGQSLVGVWTISSTLSEAKGEKPAGQLAIELLQKETFDRSLREHTAWWAGFWSKSSISIPDRVLEKQWYLEQYKFGSAARADAPPISLQAVWTADNGKLPPWKGDFHHDLNTQLSYWPAYSANHLDLEEGYLNWLWANRETFRKYTKTYFGTEGMNVPGVTTLTGEPMAGWIQYSLGPTVGCWLSQHFYLHWKYSGDKTFLQEKAYPWIKDVAIFLDQISMKNERGQRQLPLSSSPEIHDNSINAWFTQTTNYDLSFIRWTFATAAELANELNLKEESAKWKAILAEWPDYALDDRGGLAFAPGHPYVESHRHFSHLVGWHPLGQIDWSNGEKEQQIIRETLKTLEEVGPDYWCGYSYSWLGNLYARAFMGEKAAQTLRIFAENFCLPNSFHANGDQSGKGYSKFTYRPFTLEGNFAFAAGIQEMLIQSHTGVVRVFPAVPESWKDIAFSNLRTEGGFLVSAKKAKGEVQTIEIFSENGGTISIHNPFGTRKYVVSGIEPDQQKQNGTLIVLEIPKGKKIGLSPL